MFNDSREWENCQNSRDNWYYFDFLHFSTWFSMIEISFSMIENFWSRNARLSRARLFTSREFSFSIEDRLFSFSTHHYQGVRELMSKPVQYTLDPVLLDNLKFLKNHFIITIIWCRRNCYMLIETWKLVVWCGPDV